MIQQVQLEIDLMYTLVHPNIIHLYTHFEDDQNIYLQLEYAAGGQLYHRLKRAGRFEESLSRFYMHDILGAIQYLHSQNPPVIHRDIKPENLILDSEGKVKVVDFGWSNVFNKDTKRITFCGTLDYLAPEMLDQSGHGVHLDIWSLGVLLFEFLAGQAPFTPEPGILDKNLRQKMLEENIKQVKINYPPDFPVCAKDLVSKMLRRDPAKRITIPDILRHPWFQINESQSEEIEIKFLDTQTKLSKNPN